MLSQPLCLQVWISTGVISAICTLYAQKHSSKMSFIWARLIHTCVSASATTARLMCNVVNHCDFFFFLKRTWATLALLKALTYFYSSGKTIWEVGVKCNLVFFFSFVLIHSQKQIKLLPQVFALLGIYGFVFVLFFFQCSKACNVLAITSIQHTSHLWHGE